MAEVKKIVKQEGRLKFGFDVVKEDMDEPGSHQLQLLPLLRKDSQIKQLGVRVESCKPESVPFSITKLVKTPNVEVQCVDKSGSPITANIDPSRIEMLLPEGWRRVATVQLSPVEIAQAKGSSVRATPYVRLSDDRTVIAEQDVAVAIPPDDILPEQQIKPKLGIAFSLNLQGKYKVDFQNFLGLVVPFNIRATDEAKTAYASQNYQLMLEIRDEDVEYPDYQQRQLNYCFPEDALRKGDIKAAQPAPIAHFKLVPLPSAGEVTSPVAPE
jgi:hypothetical protein